VELFTFLLLVVIVLAVIGIGWETFSVGVINGFERVIDVGAPFVNDLTQEARDIINDPNLVVTSEFSGNKLVQSSEFILKN
jgi:hypothetical protein